MLPIRLLKFILLLTLILYTYKSVIMAVIITIINTCRCQVLFLYLANNNLHLLYVTPYSKHITYINWFIFSQKPHEVVLLFLFYM